MKISRKMTVILLVLVLAIVSLVPATFSWYDHNDKLSGDRMQYTRTDLPVSEGTVTLTTKKYRTEGNRVYYDEKGNKEYQGNALTSGSVAAGTTQYYGTTIKNAGDSPAYVNLYLKQFDNDPNNYIGTIAPSLTYKNISSSVHLANKNMIRVYCQFNKANNWKDSGAKLYVVYKTKTGSRDCKEITTKISAGASGSALRTKQAEILGSNITNTYYVDLADDTTEFYFATDGKNSGFNTNTLTVTQPWYRTKTITNVQAETGYYLTGVADDTTFNAQYATFNVPGGVSVMTYFDTLSIAKGQNAYVTLTNGTNYTGSSASYAKNNVTGISINQNTGLVTANNNFGKGGSATITTTITGSLGDEATVNTAVSWPAKLSAATVAMNVLVPAQTQEEQADGTMADVPGTAEIVWYIENKSADACGFNNIFYTR